VSGGHFDYQQYRFEEIETEIDRLIATNDSTIKDEYGDEIGRHYPQEVIDKFKETRDAVRFAQEMVQKVDLLVSGDTGVDSFFENWSSH